MSERNEQPPADELEMAIAALRDAPVPDGPPAPLAASTVEALRSAGILPEIHRREKRRKTMFRILRYSGVAAALSLLGVLAAWLVLMDRTASVAFADVVKNVRDAKSVTFVIKIPTIVQGKTRSVLQQKMYIQGDAYRMEIPSGQAGLPAPPGAPANLMVEIADVKQKKAIMLDYTTNSATKIEPDDKQWEAMAKGMVDPVKQLRQLKEQDAERLADEELNGQKTQVYRLKKKEIFMGLTQNPDETAKLWVDPKTGMPVRIAVGDPADKEKPFVVFEEFRWNAALEPELFKLDLPPGFALKDK